MFISHRTLAKLNGEDCAHESPRKPCSLPEGSSALKAVGRNHYGIRHDKLVRRGEGRKKRIQRLIELLSRKHPRTDIACHYEFDFAGAVVNRYAC